MKYLLTFIVICVYMTNITAQIDTLRQEMVSMADTYQKPYKVGSVYYKKNKKEAFTGVLYGKFSNGNYVSIQEYKNGIGNGTWINYYENGQIKEIGTYVDNLVQGPIKQYYKNGNLKAEGTYEHWRKEIGEWKYFSEEGKLLRTVNYN